MRSTLCLVVAVASCVAATASPHKLLRGAVDDFRSKRYQDLPSHNRTRDHDGQIVGGSTKLLFYTAAVGETYTRIATDWCASLDVLVIKPLRKLGVASSHVVLTDAAGIPKCRTRRVAIHHDPNIEDKYQLRVKLLKMYDFPEAKGADLKMWLDVDLRPTSNAAAFVRDLVEGPLSTFGPNSIGLTRTRNLDKHHYNGGLFVYRGRGCVDRWKELIFEPCSLWKHRRKPGPKGECIDAFERGRDQPYLALAAASDACDVVDLPERTQALTAWQFDGSNAFVHYAGTAKKWPRIMALMTWLRDSGW